MKEINMKKTDLYDYLRNADAIRIDGEYIVKPTSMSGNPECNDILVLTHNEEDGQYVVEINRWMLDDYAKVVGGTISVEANVGDYEEPVVLEVLQKVLVTLEEGQ